MEDKEQESGKGRRSESRVAVVKALYTSEINAKINFNKSPAHLSLDIISLYHESVEGSEAVNLDEKFLTDVIIGVCGNLDLLNKAIEDNIGDGWSLERLGPVMRSILRAAIYELMYFSDTPFKVIINEYVNITKTFFDAKEVGFVNGILDKMSNQLRPDEAK